MNECQVTNLKLQKTLYYVQGYYLYRFGKPLFDDEIVNWAYGPVVPEAYFEFCSYGANPGQIKAVLTIPLGKHRDRTSEDFLAIRDQIFEIFHMKREDAIEYYT